MKVKLTQNKQFHAVASGHCNTIMVDEVTNISSTIDSLSCNQLKNKGFSHGLQCDCLLDKFQGSSSNASTDLQQVDLQFEIHKQESTQIPSALAATLDLIRKIPSDNPGSIPRPSG
jgi:hypothetical protein